MTSKDPTGKKTKADGGTKAKPKDGGKGSASTSNVPKTGYGIVKNVLSGATVVLFGVPKAGSLVPPEKTITLSGIEAPKLQRAQSTEKDEVCTPHLHH